MVLNASSHSMAFAEEQATDGPPGRTPPRSAAEQLFEDLAVQIAFFGGRRVVREAEACGFQLLVADLFGGHFFQGIDPAVADAVRELLLLAPATLAGR